MFRKLSIFRNENLRVQSWSWGWELNTSSVEISLTCSLFSLKELTELDESCYTGLHKNLFLQNKSEVPFLLSDYALYFRIDLEKNFYLSKSLSSPSIVDNEQRDDSL